jgi:imidazolonepropionase-like amidohydrolase
MTVRSALVLAWGVLICSWTDAFGQAERVVGFRPRTVAIAGASLVTRPGETVEGGTLVIRDGVIVAAGRDVEPPADAEVIDAEGLFVYAGFLDAASSEWIDGDKNPEPAAGRKVDFNRHVLAATRPDNRHSLTPELLARDYLKGDAKLQEAARQQGFTGVHVVPAGRVAGGQGALVSTCGSPLRESLVIDATFGQLALFAPRGNNYPSTLMGATAHLRQALLDAERHALHWKLYRDGAAGIERPPVDVGLDALGRIARGEQRAMFLAQSRDDIHRALDFAGEHGLDLTLWGARDAHLAIDRLKEERVDLVVQLDFGDEPKVEPNESKDELVAEVKPPLRVQEDRRDEWRRRVGGLAALHEADVRFAVSSRGLKNRGEVFKGLRQAMEHGLCADAALAALTSDAAEVLGIGDRLGTLEPGKLGHVVVMTGPFHHEKAKVRYVLVDGQKFEYHPDAKPVPAEAETPEEQPAGPDLAGRWRDSGW